LLECVPNFSEGRRLDVVEKIVDAALGLDVFMLDVSSDPDHNRSVLTIAGAPEPLVEFVVRAALVAVERIDLRTQTGAHPRVGALDVVPFVALEGTSDVDAVEAARGCAERIWGEAGVPCFLYEEASAQRRALPEIRRGAFDSVLPDFGGNKPHATAGAACVGARKLLVAFNVNLETPDVEVAKSIASEIRESEGGLEHVRALGLRLESRSLTQVSMNLLEPLKTTVSDAFDAVASAATRRNVKVASSEIVGLTPRAALGRRDHKSLMLSQPPKVLEDEIATIAH
jgi:glutamate formiminotransferase